jgi:hypothetical protein
MARILLPTAAARSRLPLFVPPARPQPALARMAAPHVPAGVQPNPMQLAKPADVLALQRKAGNRAVARLVADARAGALPAAGLHLAREAAAHVRPINLQRKPAVVATSTYTRKVSGSLAGGSAATLKLIRKAKKANPKKRFETVDLFDSGFFHIRDSSGNIAWYRVKDPAEQEFIAAKDVLAGLQGAADFKTGGRKHEEGESGASAALDLTAGAFGAADDPTLEHYRRLEVAKNADPTKQTAGGSTELIQAEGGLWLGSGIFGMAVGFRDIVDSDKGAWDKVAAAFSVGAGIFSAQGAAAQIASTTYGDKTTEYAMSSGLGAWSLSFSEMLTGLGASVKTMKAIVDLVRMLADDKKHGKDAWVSTSGELLANGLETAKGVLRSIRAVNEAMAGGAVSEQFKQVLPGLDIAILAVKSIMQGYYLIVSAVNLHRMRKEKERLNNPMLAGKPELYSEMLTGGEQEELAHVLEQTNAKRVLRQSIHISTNLIQVGASIATYVSGPGAPAALGLKAAAMGIDLSLPILRWVKQKGRDVAERNQQQGAPGLANKIFNADKSTSAKLAERRTQAVAMLRMVAGLNKLMNDPKKMPFLREHGKRVEMYLTASGVDTDALYKLNGNAAKQVELIAKALSQRELGG